MEVREDAEQAKRTGGMVALLPADPGPLVVDGGKPAEDMHVTLAYLGADVTDWPEDQVRRLADLLQVAADETGGPIQAAVVGHATFRPASDEPVAVHLIGDTDRLAPVHARVTQILEAVLGDDLRAQHLPWLPHITGQYGAHASALGYSGPVVLDRLLLRLGPQEWVYPLLTPAQVVDELARQAFAHGWACSGGPMTPRVRAAAAVALEHVREHGPSAEVLEATIRLGSLEGTWAKVLGRRQGLYDQHDKAVLTAWRDLMDGVDLADLVTRWRHTLGIVTEYAQVNGGQPDQGARRRHEAEAALLMLLRSRVDPTEARYQALVLAVSQALRDAEAEGWAGAIALAADQLGETGIDFDRAYSDALLRLGDPGTYYNRAAADVGDYVNAMSDLLAAHLDQAADDVSADELGARLLGVLNDGKGVSILLDWALGRAFNGGVLAFFGAEGVEQVDFVTVGDDRVCQACESAEAGSPYPRGSAPTPALHPRCRCTLVNADPWKALRSVDLSRYVIGGDG